MGEPHPVGITVDVVALTVRRGALYVLLVERGEPPFLGGLALPGGFVRSRRDHHGHILGEDLDEAAFRKLAEETGLRPGEGVLDRVRLEQFATYGAPARDPRMHVVSVAYLLLAPHLPEPRPGGDARTAAWVPVAEALNLAFDHDMILTDALERARSTLECTPVATSFLGREFTIAELRAVYSAVWGEDLHPGTFRQRVLSIPGFLESAGAYARGRPGVRLYRAGDARLLHPALLRPNRESVVRR